jgi:hypothetical protein
MAGIRLTPNQFADLVIAFLLDSIIKNDEILPDNHEFHYIIKKIERAGIKSQLLSYYIDTSPVTRGKYKTIRDSFTGDANSSNNIVITPSPDTSLPDDEKTTIKNIVKQTLKMIRSHKIRRNNGMPLNEEVVDKIINKVLEKQNG